ncbi:uncharacterized protein C8A04DRAFT_13522 [Dichotomopilus funicola]|uniref:C2H2-type domain-containing protein n=1 Tax=Dichotomopilus funicola TaxID=1934379 RepID=A0AAN6UZF3_9PEZI|nr:hypothetical protein C8A04DRAFT_13522 [Dichotomopilus funicola]
MASLSFIMDVTDDHTTTAGRRPLPSFNKRDRSPDDKPSTPSGVSVQVPAQGRSHTTSPGPVQVEQDINPAAPAGQTIRHGASPKKPKPVSVVVGSAPAATATATATATAKAKAGTTTTSKRSRRPSNTANDPMDRSRYGSASSASTVSNAGLQRPVPPPHVSPTPYTPKYTPKTGRVSKAKKGLPVHVCDICRPIKTFTRAEHLRRHQLGHGAPQFQCTSCDRAFHRADLLMRHQQKHETDGDAASKTGSSHHSPQPSPSLSFQQVQQSPRTPRTPGSGLPASLTETELPSAPSSAAAVKQAGFASTGRLPHHEGGTPASSYRGASQPPPQGFHRASPFSPTVSIVNPTRPFHAGGYQHHHQQQAQQQHRNTHTPAPLYVVTESLQLPSLHATVADLPDLRDTSSPIPSSAATDSTYSAPLSDVSSRNPLTSMMTPRGGNRSPYLSSAGATTAASARNDAAPSLAHGPMFVNPYPGHQASEHAFGGAQGISSPVMGGYTTAGTNHHHHQQQHQQSGSLPSLRARTPPLDAFSHHSSETMIATSPRLPAHFDPLSGYDRRKDSMLELHHDLLVSQASLEGLGVLGSLAAGYGSAVSPGVEIASHHGGGNGGGNGGSIITDMADLAALGGSGSPALPGARCSTTTNLTTAGGVGMTIPLPGPIRAAIPRYLEVYWARVDPDLPIVHRTSFEAAPEDVLRCAMAAVATQGLDSAEDRAQGAVLHEFAWQEVKRIPQWSLQTMQAILLCEHFARFRGRKAVTRPSGPFESLYSRALYQNPALLDRSMLAAEQQHLSVHERWHNWIDTESRRRLLAACIFVDIHAAVYQQQGRVQDTDLSTQLIPLLGRATELWACGSAEEWVSILAADPGALQPEHFPPSLEHLTADGVAARSLPDRMIILSVLAQHLTPTSRGVSNQGGGFLSSSPRTTSLSPGSTPCPELDPHNYHHGPFHPPPPQHNARMISSSFSFDAEERIATLFPTCPIGQTYLALHHTPLRDLLAVSGDSWVFSQKGIPEASFLEHRKRLRAWVGAAMSGKSVIRATVHAARAILGFMGHLPSAQQQNSSYYGYEEQLPDYESLSLSFSSWNINISDYWAMYVCALICWAFAHSASPAHLNQTQNQPQSYIQGRAGGSRNTTNTASTTTGSSSSMTLTLPLSHSRPHPYSHSSSPSLSSSAIPSPQINSPTPTPTPTTTKQESTALTWLRNIATSAAGPRLEINAAAAIGVVALVRRRLEADWLGSKCRSRLYVDAVGVLGKVEEGAGWRWF